MRIFRWTSTRWYAPFHTRRRVPDRCAPGPRASHAPPVLWDPEAGLQSIVHPLRSSPRAFWCRQLGAPMPVRLLPAPLSPGKPPLCEHHPVAGKTGTALKYNSKEKLNTFVSIFPASRPLYVLLVMLDEPKPAPNFVYEFPPSEKFPNGYKHKGEMRSTSGWNTVVVAGKIIEKIGPILAINSLQASK